MLRGHINVNAQQRLIVAAVLVLAAASLPAEKLTAAVLAAEAI